MCHKCSLEDWEVFDVDKAGCVVCGRLHQCRDGGDCIGAMDHDHQACEITGCWIRNRNFQQGYTDTAMPCVRHSADLHHGGRIWVEGEHVVRWLHSLVFSDAARRCIDGEIQRVKEKAQVAFARVAKGFKVEERQPNLLHMFAETREALGNIRMPCKVVEKQKFDSLVQVCVVAVVTFTSNFRWILMPFVPVVKVDHFVIGLLYLLRNGIVMFDTVQVLPRIPLLRRLLPMETCLKAQFKIPCKIITEVENITKIALKALDRNRIQAMMGIQ